MLHITNGDSFATVLAAAGVDGTIVPWREALSQGPPPSAEGDAGGAEKRAVFLADEYRVGIEGSRNQLLEMEQMLEKADQWGEIVLWFDRDLFCQANMMFLLARLFRVAPERVSCIQSPERNLVESSTAELRSLFSERVDVGTVDLESGARAWEMWSSSDPRGIERYIEQPGGSLPYLSAALRLHLQRFPSTENGLGAIEQWLLEQIDAGENRFGPLFSRFSTEQSGYGMGDWQIWRTLERLGQGPAPLLHPDSTPEEDRAPIDADLGDQTYQLTDTGRSVLAGTTDYMEISPVDEWLGGVNLADGDKWRWDRKAETIVAKE